MTKDTARKLFNKGHHGTQSALAAKYEITGLSVTDSLKIATGFGAGMAKMQQTCGAVSGDCMVTGAIRDKTYGLIGEYNTRFIALHGSLHCRELPGVDLPSEDGLQSKCAQFVGDAEKIPDEILA